MVSGRCCVGDVRWGLKKQTNKQNQGAPPNGQIKIILLVYIEFSLYIHVRIYIYDTCVYAR